MAIDSADMDRNVRVSGTQRRDPFRRRDEREQFEPAQAPLLEEGYRGHGRATGGQHRIEYVTDVEAGLTTELVVIGDRFQGLVVAIKPKMPYFRFRNRVQDCLGHAQARAEDG